MRSRRASPQLPLPFGSRSASGQETAGPSRPPAPRLAREAEPAPLRATNAALHPVDDAARLAARLESVLGSRVKLRVHDNRSTMVSFRRESGLLHLRVHHMFLQAGGEVVQALAEYTRARSPDAGRVLDHYVKNNRAHIKPPNDEWVRSRPLRTRGETHDLDELFDGLNRRYFGGKTQARIGWGRGSPTHRRRRSIRMGAYFHETRTILIHPALDRPEVPRYFVELVVYHEMLHEAVPQYRGPDGRRCIHSAEFRARERLFHDFERARAWESRHLGLLLRPSSPVKRPARRPSRS